jgi:hypothetical protein
VNKLTDKAIKAARSAGKPRKVFDGAGLYLLVTPAGGKLWRFKYRSLGKEGLLALGAYPDVTLKDAREQAATARDSLAAGPARKGASSSGSAGSLPVPGATRRPTVAVPPVARAKGCAPIHSR